MTGFGPDLVKFINDTDDSRIIQLDNPAVIYVNELCLGLFFLDKT